MYDRDQLLDEIADAVDGAPSGELSVRWWTQDGTRYVEVSKVANWVRLTKPIPGGRPTPQAVQYAREVYRLHRAHGTDLTDRALSDAVNGAVGRTAAGRIIAEEQGQ